MQFLTLEFEQLSGRMVLEAILFITTGERDFALNGRFRDALFRDLTRFQRIQERAGKPTITIPAIRSWFGSGGPKRTQALIFLYRYISDWKEREPVALTHERSQVLSKLEKYLKEILLEEEKINTPSIYVDPISAITINTLVGVSSRNVHSATSAFFRGGDGGDDSDISYYIALRYSSNHGSVLKSFISIKKPSKETAGQYSFTHFVWPGDKEFYAKHVFRECTGVVIKMERAFYLAGYDYMVPVDKRQFPKRYAAERVKARLRPNALCMIAVEYEDVERSNGLLSGVTMTVAAAHQPVVGRIALLHVGTRSSMMLDVSDELVIPAELAEAELGEDLRKTIRRLREAKCDKFSDYIEEKIKKLPSLEEVGLDIAREAINIIDNTPGWERVLAKKRRQKRKARGAIETPGPGRPRN